MTSAMIPDQIKPVIKKFLAGDRDRAADSCARVLPAINHERRQCGFRVPAGSGGIRRTARAAGWKPRGIDVITAR